MVAATPPSDPGEALHAPAPAAVIAHSWGIETIEVRWWHDRPFPSQVRDVCTDAGTADRELEQRVDTYLRHCGDDLSVKIRGGDTPEVKQRCGPVVASVLAGEAQGRVEHWRKWKLGVVAGTAPDVAGPSAASAARNDPAHHWVPVLKSRCLVDEGPVTVELSEIRTPERIHWTFALETSVEFGLAGLRDAADALALGRFPRWFCLARSASYATFVEPPVPARFDQATSG